jgi:SpoVK/Ycf46/Vps4 family AAA+-type ATPase
MWEVSHVNAVLQRMERTKSVALFTTNLVEMLDPAVERRMLFKIRFSPPGLSARKGLWRALVPRQAPQSCLDYDLLAEVELTGGEIKNAILAGCIEAVSGPGELTTDLLFALALEAADHRLHDIYEEERRRTGRGIGFGSETTCG